MSVKLSIIVPVYNVEDYLDECIMSILNQKFTDFELLLINDGSTDNSLKICQKYLSIDKRVRLIDKENGGISSARNIGIENALGEYIGFVDSDDWINPNMYKILIDLIENEHADIVVCNFHRVKSRTKEVESKLNYKSIVLDSYTAFREFLLMNIPTFLWNKIYKRELFTSIKFPEGKLYEDEFIMYKLLNQATKIVKTDYVGYNYYWREDSIMNGKFSNNQFDLLEAVSQVINYTKANYPKLIGLAYYKFIYVNMLFYNKLNLTNEYKTEMNFIRKNMIKKIFKVPFFQLDTVGKKVYICSILVCLKIK